MNAPGVGGEPVAAVLVPTHNGGRRLEAMLDSLAAQTLAHEVIVVDNGSRDSTQQVLARRPEVTAIRLERNVGFGSAVNIAVRHTDRSALVLVNDDCVLDGGFVAGVCAALDPAAGVVMAAGVLLDARDPGLIDTAGIELDSTLLGFDYLNGEPLRALEGRPPDPIGPCGAAAAFDRDAFLAVGGFDETLFAYWEDVDIALRLREQGGTCRLACGARGVHAHASTLGSGSRAKDELLGFGRGYLLRKWSVGSAARLPRILAREIPIVAGQAIMDRNLGGVRGRIRGWSAATERRQYPNRALAGAVAPGLAQTLRRRLLRRRRLRATRHGGGRGAAGAAASTPSGTRTGSAPVGATHRRTGE